MSTKDQLHDFFKKRGMHPENIRHNDNLDVYFVDIGVQGTDEKFREDVYESGDEDPVTETVDTDALKRMQTRLNGSTIPNGRITVIDTMCDSHFRIKVS